MIAVAVDEATAKARMSVCERCPELRFFLFWKQCDICKCFLDIKTKVKGASCPIGKW